MKGLSISKSSTQRTRFIYCSNSSWQIFWSFVCNWEKNTRIHLNLVVQLYIRTFWRNYSLEKELNSKDVAAFIVEPIQGEGGIIVPPTDI